MTPPRLSTLTLHPRDEADLRWLLTGDYRGDCGVRSAMGPQVEALRLGRTHVERNIHLDWFPDEDSPQLVAIRRLRRVHARWRSLPVEHQRVLVAVFGERNQAHEEAFRAFRSPELGVWLGRLVLASPAARQAHSRSRSPRSLEEWLARLSQRLDGARGSGGKRQRERDRELVDRLVTAAERQVRAAVAAYSGAKEVRRVAVAA